MARRCKRLRRASGFSLVEILVAGALSGLLCSGLLMMVRGELMAFELSEQVGRAQTSSRAGMDLVEGLLRRACGGMSLGTLGLNLPSAQGLTSCVRVWDGALPSGGSFTHGAPAGAADAVEIVYAAGFSSVATAPPVLTSTPSVTVADASGFAVGDYVLIGDWQQADLFQVSAISQGTLNLGNLPLPVVSPTAPPLTLAAGAVVLKARTVALYVSGGAASMLMLDPDGMAGSDHLDAQPLVDHAIDLQLAVAIDNDTDGSISESADGTADEWWGNAPGELPILPAPPYNGGVGYPQPRQLRASLLVETANNYVGAQPALGPYEDRSSYVTAAAGPRHRSTRMVVAPRMWNLGE